MTTRERPSSAFGGLHHEERHCRYCDTELLLRNGKVPYRPFGGPGEPVRESVSELYDNHQYYWSHYVYCNEECQRVYKSWEGST